MYELDVLERNVAEVRGRISAAAARAGRNSDGVRLVAATKYVGADALPLLARVGVSIIGENRVQEVTKRAAMVKEWLSRRSRDVAGGLAPHCREVVGLLNGFGFDVILVETVGAGQADVAVRELAEHTLLLLMPESGDAIQFSKAGIMEIADGFVLNKCDLAGADATEAQLRSALGQDRPIWKVSSVRDEGIDTVADWIASLKAR